MNRNTANILISLLFLPLVSGFARKKGGLSIQVHNTLFQLGNNDHVTAKFIGEVDPRFVSRLPGQNKQEKLFYYSRYGRYDKSSWQKLKQSVASGWNPSQGGSFIVVDWKRNPNQRRVSLLEERIHNEEYFEADAILPQYLTDAVLASDINVTIYEGNHRARIAKELKIPLPVEIRFFGGTERFVHLHPKLKKVLESKSGSANKKQEIEFAEGFDDSMTSEGLKTHIEKGLGLPDTFFRLGSEGYLDMFSEIKAYWSKRNVVLRGPTKWMIENLEVGTPAIYKGERVFLDVPFRSNDGKKKFTVYHNSGRKNKDGEIIAKKIRWGDPVLTVKNDQYDRSKSFWKRHQCDNKKKMNPMKPGFWACYGPTLFASQLELQSDMPW